MYFLVDNLGMGELSSYSGGPYRGVTTTRLDNFAKEGMMLLNFGPEAQCTPVNLKCVTFGSVVAKPPNPCEIADVNPSDLPPDSDMNLQPKSTDLHFIVYFSVPKDQNYAAIYFTVSGDNLSSGGPFSVTVNLGFCGRCPPWSRVCELLSWHYRTSR